MNAPIPQHNAEFKLARLSDAALIATLARDLVEAGLPWSWRPKRVAASIRHPETNVLTVWVDGRLRGFAIMEFLVEHAHLNLLAVEPSYRRFGLGRQLVEWLEETARVGGIRTIKLEVRAGNSDARVFYQRLGYREMNTIPGYYGRRETAVCMEHDLSRR
ncbi:MAG: GNAT family N-acetyltransferase [Candidatus Binatia bacterium]